MTDLKRERALIDELYAGDKGLFYWSDEDTRRIAKALADAERRGAEEMRERIAVELAATSPYYARLVRALPLTPEEPT